MLLAIKKTGGKTDHFHGANAFMVWRAFRAALWERGIKRDPLPGDAIDGVRIIALAL